METRANAWPDGVRQTTAQPRAVRLLFPSVADLIFVVLLVTFSFTALSTRLLNDAGIGWHIRDGQQILTTYSVPHTDSFSSTMSGKAWFAWEWLYDALIAAIYNRTGLNGVVFFSAALIAVTFAATFRIALRRGAGIPVAVVMVVLGASASTIHFYARPHVFSWIFTLIWFQLLDSAESSPASAKQLYWLPVITLVWVNLHGGFLIGFVLLGIYLAAAVLQYARELRSAWPNETLAVVQAGRWLRTLGVIAVLSAVASFVNPYGYKLHAHIYAYLTDRFLMNHIDEFHSPNFHGIAQQCFAALLLITLAGLAAARKRLRISHVIVIIFAIYSGLYASRNLPTSSILLVLIIAPEITNDIRGAAGNSAVSLAVRRFFARVDSFDLRMRSMEMGLTGHLLPIALIAVGVGACANQGRLGSQQLINAQFSAKRFPIDAVSFLAGHDMHEPVFAPDYWGGYLIYRLYPQTKVVIDDRHDLYGDEFINDYLKVVHVDPPWSEVLTRMNVRLVLTPSDSPLANVLRIAPDWRLIYGDNVGVLFERNSTAAGDAR